MILVKIVIEKDTIPIKGRDQAGRFLAKLGDPEKYPVPTIDRYGIVHVTDGGTRLYEATVTPRDWVAFRACLNLHDWRKNGGKAA